VAPEDIVELFSSFGPVDVRRMFGGLGIYADSMMFALVVDGTIYLKSGDSNRAMFEREALEPFSYLRAGRPQVITSYRRMPDRLYDDPEELAQWGRAALAVANTKRAAQKRSPRKRPARQR
jgi:DNA transformation protein and related proteins